MDAAPGRSKCRRAVSTRLSVRRRGLTKSTTTPTGTLMKNTHDQLSELVRAAQEDAGSAAAARDGSPDPERHVALAPLLEHDRQGRERGRRNQRRAQPLERPEGDQRPLR